MTSVQRAVDVLDRWRKQIKAGEMDGDREAASEGQSIELVVTVEDAELKGVAPASSEEKQAVLQYWSSVFAGRQEIQKKLLSDDFQGEGTSNGATFAYDKNKLLSSGQFISENVRGVDQLSLRVYKQGEQLVVKYNQQLDFQKNGSTTKLSCSGSQSWKVIPSENHRIQFAKVYVTEEVKPV